MLTTAYLTYVLSQLSLGLAVDLTWKTGLSFDIDIQ